MENVIKRVNVKALIFSLSLYAAAIAAFITSYQSFGILLILISTTYLFLKFKIEIYNPTGSPVKRYSLFFEKDNLQKFEEILRGDMGDNTVLFNFSDSGSARADIVITKDETFSAVKLYRFIPYKYEEATDYIEFNGPQSLKLARYLERCNKR